MTTKVRKKPAADPVVYKLGPDMTVIREKGSEVFQIGQFDGSHFVFDSPETEKFRIPTFRWIREKGYHLETYSVAGAVDPDDGDDQGGAPDIPKAPPPSAPSAEAPKAPEAPKALELSTAEKAFLEAERNGNVEKGIPPAPKKTKRDGDKTAAYVEWMKQYFPDRFREHYGIQGEGEVTKFREERQPITNRPYHVPYQVRATISRRKIHLTEKPDARESEDEQQ